MKKSAITISVREPASVRIGRIALMGLLLGSVALAAGPARAAGCDSAAKVMSDIWGEYDDVFKKLGCAVVTVASDGSVPPNACMDAADKAAKVAEDMISFWNRMANNSWATIGPRELPLGDTVKGKLVSTGGRVFVSTQPLNDDQVVLKIDKTDGKAKTSVTVCKDYRGTKTKLWEFTIPNGKDLGHWSRTLTGMKGRVLTVHLDAKSVTNTMSYELKASKN